jgi:hypothetical protein
VTPDSSDDFCHSGTKMPALGQPLMNFGPAKDNQGQMLLPEIRLG